MKIELTYFDLEDIKNGLAELRKQHVRMGAADSDPCRDYFEMKARHDYELMCRIDIALDRVMTYGGTTIQCKFK